MNTLRRWKRLITTDTILFDLFQPGPHRGYTVLEGIPADVQLVNVRHGWENTIELLLESETFPHVEEGQEIPLLNIAMRAEEGPLARLPQFDLVISRGAERILAERARQIGTEDYDATHDAEHTRGELAVVAACYAVHGLKGMLEDPIGVGSTMVEDAWPWDRQYDKRDQHSRERRLEIAGALIAAELDRLENHRLDQALAQVTKLNLCCGAYPVPDALNIDMVDVRPYWKKGQREPWWTELVGPLLPEDLHFFQHDLEHGMSFLEEGQIEEIHLDNALCSFNPEKARGLLAECWRILKAGGKLRIIGLRLGCHHVPDAPESDSAVPILRELGFSLEGIWLNQSADQDLIAPLSEPPADEAFELIGAVATKPEGTP